MNPLHRQRIEAARNLPGLQHRWTRPRPELPEMLEISHDDWQVMINPTNGQMAMRIYDHATDEFSYHYYGPEDATYVVDALLPGLAGFEPIHYN